MLPCKDLAFIEHFQILSWVFSMGNTALQVTVLEAFSWHWLLVTLLTWSWASALCVSDSGCVCVST